MSRQACTLVTWLLIVLVGITGCHPTQPFYLHEDGDLSHYLDRATEIEFPDVQTASLAEVEQAQPPLNVAEPDFQHFWDLTLEEVISLALHNSKVIRNVAAVTQFGFADGLLNRTATSSTVFDAALTESSTLGGPRPVDRSTGSLFLSELQTQATQQGVEDALSEFDAQFFSSVNYGTTDRPRNVQAGNPFNPIFFRQETGSFLAGLSKKSAGGGLYSFRNRTTYTSNNIPVGIGRALPSDWQTEFEVEVQYPLMRGRGEQVNRIPIVLARINTDISLADFEASTRNLLKDIENTYWDLYMAYRSMETARTARDAAQATWKITSEKARRDPEGRVTARDEAQAQEQYFFFRAALETAQNELFEMENRLRWLMGLTATDGRVIRPKDEPVTAEVHYDWIQVRTEGLLRYPELRQQKWRLKQRELELIAAKNQLLPRLNATGQYRWIGVGDELMNADRNGLNFPAPGSTAFDELVEGNFQEAFFGLEFTPPQFGARRPLAAVRHAQLQLARTKAQLEDMELQAVHLMGTAWRSTKFRYALATSHFDRWAASQTEVEIAQSQFESGRVSLDFVLDAFRRRAQSQVDFYRALVDYNKAIADVHFYKGSLLEYNGIQLAEGAWPEKAYWDALERARERDASQQINYGWTRPKVVSKGPVPQGGAMLDDAIDGWMPGAESIPAPEPTPLEPLEEPEQPAPMDNGPMDQPPSEAAPRGPITSRPRAPQHASGKTAAAPAASSRRTAAETHYDEEIIPASATLIEGSTERPNPLRGSTPKARGLR